MIKKGEFWTLFRAFGSIKGHGVMFQSPKVQQQSKGYPEINQHRDSFDNILRDKLPFTVEKPGRNQLNKRSELISPVIRHIDIMYLLM